MGHIGGLSIVYPKAIFYLLKGGVQGLKRLRYQVWALGRSV